MLDPHILSHEFGRVTAEQSRDTQIAGNQGSSSPSLDLATLDELNVCQIHPYKRIQV